MSLVGVKRRRAFFCVQETQPLCFMDFHDLMVNGAPELFSEIGI